MNGAEKEKATFLLEKSIQRELCGTAAELIGKHGLDRESVPGR